MALKVYPYGTSTGEVEPPPDDPVLGTVVWDEFLPLGAEDRLESMPFAVGAGDEVVIVSVADVPGTAIIEFTVDEVTWNEVAADVTNETSGDELAADQFIASPGFVRFVYQNGDFDQTSFLVQGSID